MMVVLSNHVFQGTLTCDHCGRQRGKSLRPSLRGEEEEPREALGGWYVEAVVTPSRGCLQELEMHVLGAFLFICFPPRLEGNNPSQGFPLKP